MGFLIPAISLLFSGIVGLYVLVWHLAPGGLYRVCRTMRKRFGFTDNAGLFRSAAVSRGRIEGRRVVLTFAESKSAELSRFVLESDHFLPIPIAIESGSCSIDFPEGYYQPLRIGIEAVKMLVAAARPQTHGKTWAEIVTRLKERAVQFIAYDNVLILEFPSWLTRHGSAPDIIADTARLISHFIVLLGETDFEALLVNYAAERPVERRLKKRFIEEIVRSWPEHPASRNTLNRLLAGDDFTFGLLAAEAIGIDRLEFGGKAIFGNNHSLRRQAVRWFCEPDVPGGIDFLLDCYGKSNNPYARIEIISGLRQDPDSRLPPFFLRALVDPNPDVAAAAVAVLSERGGPDALARLYSLSMDTALPSSLRDSARNATIAISVRCGVTTDGSLSFAAQGIGSGELSLTENPGNDSLDRTGNDHQTDGASDE